MEPEKKVTFSTGTCCYLKYLVVFKVSKVSYSISSSLLTKSKIDC